MGSEPLFSCSRAYGNRIGVARNRISSRQVSHTAFKGTRYSVSSRRVASDIDSRSQVRVDVEWSCDALLCSQQTGHIRVDLTDLAICAGCIYAIASSSEFYGVFSSALVDVVQMFTYGAKKVSGGITDNVLPVTKSLIEKLRSLGNQPDEVEISFGVKLSTVAGAIIASASTKANSGVTVRWTGKKEAVLSQS